MWVRVGERPTHRNLFHELERLGSMGQTFTSTVVTGRVLRPSSFTRVRTSRVTCRGLRFDRTRFPVAVVVPELQSGSAPRSRPWVYREEWVWYRSPEGTWTWSTRHFSSDTTRDTGFGKGQGRGTQREWDLFRPPVRHSQEQEGHEVLQCHRGSLRATQVVTPTTPSSPVSGEGVGP